MYLSTPKNKHSFSENRDSNHLKILKIIITTQCTISWVCYIETTYIIDEYRDTTAFQVGRLTVRNGSRQKSSWAYVRMYTDGHTKKWAK